MSLPLLVNRNSHQGWTTNMVGCGLNTALQSQVFFDSSKLHIDLHVAQFVPKRPSIQCRCRKVNSAMCTTDRVYVTRYLRHGLLRCSPSAKRSTYVKWRRRCLQSHRRRAFCLLENLNLKYREKKPPSCLWTRLVPDAAYNVPSTFPAYHAKFVKWTA